MKKTTADETKYTALLARAMLLYGVETEYRAGNSPDGGAYSELVMTYLDADGDPVRTWINLAPVSGKSASRISDGHTDGIPEFMYGDAESLAKTVLERMAGREWSIAGINRAGYVFKSIPDLEKFLDTASRDFYRIRRSTGYTPDTG